MPFLSIFSEGKDRLIAFGPGKSVREVLDPSDLRVRTGCRGSGACGLCRIQILAGKVDEPTKNELIYLSGPELREGIRLACQVTAEEDLRIRVLSPALHSNWRKLSLDETPGEPSLLRAIENPPDGEETAYGVAIDLGTTTISMTLWDVSRGKRLSGFFGLNQQERYGSDVMTRLFAACGTKKSSKELSQSIKDCIAEGLLEMCSSEGYDPRRIKHVAIVGNTAMLSLISEKGSDLLIQPEYWTRRIDCRPRETKDWFEGGNIGPEAAVSLHQPLAGFIGSDLLAGVLGTRLTEKAAGSLLIDFGTNSEIALWDGNCLWVTSASGGPAFEGCGIRCGTPAGTGAIYKVESYGGSGLALQVIGGGEAQGICGSGMVDLMAYLTRTGKVDKKGRFTAELPDGRFLLSWDNPKLFWDSGNIDLFQRAKAAIGTGVRVLLRSARMRVEALQRLCVCGSFGRYLDILNAQEIGLLPSVPLERVELCGNAALKGCELLLRSPAKSDPLETLREKSRLVNLSQVPEFEDLFLESLFLRPMPRD
jgi:uncharacterized 2Fe-2S/4Fe-4S cluster protein (DUF4445 family)